MSRVARLLVASVAATLVVPALARAEERVLTFTTGPISVEAYGVAQEPLLADSPRVDGYVVGMDAEVVDASGRVQGRDKVMLHHIVFAKLGVPDYTCGGAGQRFFAEGEERLALTLPRGFGYANKATDRWGLLYMLMNHKPRRLDGYIRYRVRYVTGETLTPVKPVWLDIRNCTGPDPVFDVAGGGKRFSTFAKTADFTAPESGRLVSGGGHLHGGGIRLELRNATCRTTPFTSRPTWVGPLPRPILHEPGPTKMSSFRSTDGIPVAKGQTLRLAAVYDNGRPHTRAMGIMLLFLAPGAVEGCGATPVLELDPGRPSAPPPFSMPLPRAPSGTCLDHALDLGRRLPLRRRADPVEARRHLHLELPRRGPARRDRRGRPGGILGAVDDVRRLQAPIHQSGVYRLFCSLHPSRMVQQITVR